jgi:hypothetical protein
MAKPSALVLLGATVLASPTCRCGAERSSPAQHCPAAASATEGAKPLMLDGTMTELRDFFEATSGSPRFVAFLSPSCPACQQGARAIRQSLVDASKSRCWAIAIVWIAMRPDDDDAALARAASAAAHPQVRQFYDRERAAGWAFARAAFPGVRSPAWDVYLFYEADARWLEDNPPAPTAKLAQFLGKDGSATVASDVDAAHKPVVAGPGERLGELLTERFRAIDAAPPPSVSP